MNVAFAIVFAIFVVMMLGLAVVAVRWAVRRDRAARIDTTGVAAAPAGAAPTTDVDHAPGAPAAPPPAVPVAGPRRPPATKRPPSTGARPAGDGRPGRGR
jgi:hypothetical protein